MSVKVWKYCLMAAAVSSADAVASQAQEVTPFDAAASYAARHTEHESDNDIARLSLGAAWAVLDGAVRLGLDLGVRNENFTGDYPAVVGSEVFYALERGDVRYGLGAQIGYAEDRGTAGTVGVAAEHFGKHVNLHGILGAYYLDSPQNTKGASQSSAYLQGDATWFVTEDWSVNAGMMVAADGDLWGIGSEYLAEGWPFSMFFEWGHATDTYRTIDRYNDLTVGFRYIPKRYTLQSYRRNNLSRMMAVYTEPQ